MTLASTTSKLLYNGDGSTTVFAVSFVFWQNGDIRAVHRDAGGAETIWVEGVHYTLTGGGGATGTLTVKTMPTDHTPAAGEKLLIKSDLPETQGASLPLGGAFPSTTVEQMVDFVTRLVQQHSEEIARSFIAAETDDNPGVLPSSGERASKFLAFDAGGAAIAAPGSVSEVAVSAFGATLVDDADAAAALTTLGVDAAKAQALGTAAVKDTGAADGNVIVADATGLPVIDGSQLTAVAAASAADIILGSDAQGDVLFRGASVYERLGAGTDGQFLKTQGAAANPVWASPITLETAVATTSGTSANFTGIPAGVKRITMMFNGVSVSPGGGVMRVRIGDSGGLETSGYVSYSEAATLTNGFSLGSTGVADIIYGSMVLELYDEAAFTWSATHAITWSSGPTSRVGGGIKSLSAELDRISLVVTGTSFNAGSVNIMYE